MKLPKTVYVYWFDDGPDNRWMSVESSLDDCATQGEKRLVGVYELKEKVNVELEIKTSVISSKA